MTSSACTDRTRFSGVTISTFSLAIVRPSLELQLLRLPRDRLRLHELRVRQPRRLSHHVPLPPPPPAARPPAPRAPPPPTGSASPASAGARAACTPESPSASSTAGPSL